MVERAEETKQVKSISERGLQKRSIEYSGDKTTLQTLSGTQQYCKDCRKCTYRDDGEMQKLYNAQVEKELFTPLFRSSLAPIEDKM